MADEKINFEEEQGKAANGMTEEMAPDDFMGGNYLKNPAVGAELVFVVEKVMKNKVTSATNKTTGKAFDVGVKDRKGNVKRIDIITQAGETYTVSNWEIYFKLLEGQKGLLMTYAKNHNGAFKGAKVRIKKLLDGGHANTKMEDLMKILGKDRAASTAYQAEIKQAIKETRLYEVTLVG